LWPSPMVAWRHRPRHHRHRSCNKLLPWSLHQSLHQLLHHLLHHHPRCRLRGNYPLTVGSSDSPGGVLGKNPRWMPITFQPRWVENERGFPGSLTLLLAKGTTTFPAPPAASISAVTSPSLSLSRAGITGLLPSGATAVRRSENPGSTRRFAIDRAICSRSGFPGLLTSPPFQLVSPKCRKLRPWLTVNELQIDPSGLKPGIPVFFGELFTRFGQHSENPDNQRMSHDRLLQRWGWWWRGRSTSGTVLRFRGMIVLCSRDSEPRNHGRPHGRLPSMDRH
jgi:hypothetical protein